MTDFEIYYKEREPLLYQTATSLETLLGSLLDVENQQYLSVSSRVKTLDSCLEKIERKKYPDPRNSLTDLVGIRVIVYFEHQINEVEKLFRENIEVDEKYSSHKDNELGNDKIGYRSLHLTGKISPERSHLKEYSKISDQSFEIQIRTVLQHAWAELAHDRAYKLSGGLPTNIQRDVNLYAGLLEIADKAFSKIVKQVQEYEDGLLNSDISSESINVLSLSRFIQESSKKHSINVSDRIYIDEIVAEEAIKFGFKSIRDIQEKMTPDFLTAERRFENAETSIGLLRNIMIWNDPERYFRDCWNNNWNGISPASYRMFRERHPNFRSLLDQFEIEILDDMEFEGEEED